MSLIRLKIGVSVCLAMILLSCFSIPAVASNEKYWSQEGRFKIAFEGEPLQLNTVQDSEFGKMTWNAYAYKTLQYLGIVMYCDLPDPIFVGVDSQVILEQVFTSMVANETLITKKALTLSNINAIEYESSSGNNYIKRILLIAGKRMYVCGVQTTKESIDSAQVDGFMDSFEIVMQ